MKGWRTITLNAGTVFIAAGLQALQDFEWAMHVDGTWALIIVATINILLRIVTNTPVGQETPASAADVVFTIPEDDPVNSGPRRARS